MTKQMLAQPYIDANASRIRDDISILNQQIKFATVQVGNDPRSTKYVNMKTELLKSYDIEVTDYIIPDVKSYNDVMLKYREIITNHDAVLLQLPVPGYEGDKSLEYMLRTMTPVNKDVDCVSPASLQHVLLGDSKELNYPCTARAIIDLLEFNGVKLENKNVVIIGRSALIGRPLSMMMLDKNANVTITHSKTSDVNKKLLTKNADIIVSCVGRPNMVTPDMIKDGVILVDTGVSFVDGKIVGDINKECYEKASLYTPYTKSIGPMTIFELLEQTVRSSLITQQLDEIVN